MSSRINNLFLLFINLILYTFIFLFLIFFLLISKVNADIGTGYTGTISLLSSYDSSIKNCIWDSTCSFPYDINPNVESLFYRYTGYLFPSSYYIVDFETNFYTTAEVSDAYKYTPYLIESYYDGTNVSLANQCSLSWEIDTYNPVPDNIDNWIVYKYKIHCALETNGVHVNDLSFRIGWRNTPNLSGSGEYFFINSTQLTYESVDEKDYTSNLNNITNEIIRIEQELSTTINQSNEILVGTLTDPTGGDLGLISGISTIDNNNFIGQLLTMPLTWFTGINNSINSYLEDDVCTPWTLIKLSKRDSKIFGGLEVVLPCGYDVYNQLGFMNPKPVYVINTKYSIRLYDIIDMIMNIGLIVAISQFIIKRINKMTTFEDDFNELYTPDNSYSPKGGAE